jgi:hypothetical protein
MDWRKSSRALPKTCRMDENATEASDMRRLSLEIFAVMLLCNGCAGGKGPPREVAVIEREDGLSVMLTVDRERLTWTMVVRNESDHPIAVYARTDANGASECGSAMVRFRDRERHFLYNDSEMPVMLPGAWYIPASASSRQAALPVQMEQIPPGEQIVVKRRVEDLMQGLSANVTRDPRRWLADYEFQIESTVSYQDAYLRRQIEVRTDWIASARASAETTRPSR